jgi:two-component system OmpR family response regulator
MRLLVVDDEARLAALLKRGLEEGGHVVDVVGDGPEALWMASEQSYDAIILDVMLPTLDGVEVCRRLRDQEVWTPVLMLSALGEVDDRVHALDCGADDYLAKPFTFAELGARLRALKRRGAQARPTILTAGDLKLYPATRQAWRGSTELALSAKEFALLELLMRHPGEVLSRTWILEHGWDFAFEGVSNVVDQYIRYLRNKIDRPFGRTDLETVRGAGYRLRAPAQT